MGQKVNGMMDVKLEGRGRLQHDEPQGEKNRTIRVQMTTSRILLISTILAALRVYTFVPALSKKDRTSIYHDFINLSVTSESVETHQNCRVEQVLNGERSFLIANRCLD